MHITLYILCQNYKDKKGNRKEKVWEPNSDLARILNSTENYKMLFVKGGRKKKLADEILERWKKS